MNGIERQSSMDMILEAYLPEMFDSRIEFNPSIEEDEKGQRLIQYFIVNDETYRVAGIMMDIGPYKRVLHVEFANMSDDEKLVYNLLGTHKKYIGDVYGIIMNWIMDLSNHENMLKNHNYIVVINDEAVNGPGLSRFYGKIKHKFITLHPEYVSDPQLEFIMKKFMKSDRYALFAVKKIGV